MWKKKRKWWWWWWRHGHGWWKRKRTCWWLSWRKWWWLWWWRWRRAWWWWRWWRWFFWWWWMSVLTVLWWWWWESDILTKYAGSNFFGKTKTLRGPFRELVVSVLMVSVLKSWWLMVSVLLLVSWWSLNCVSVVVGILVALSRCGRKSWRCSVMFWVLLMFSSCFCAVLAVFRWCFGGIEETVLFLKENGSPDNTKLASTEMWDFAIGVVCWANCWFHICIIIKKHNIVWQSIINYHKPSLITFIIFHHIPIIPPLLIIFVGEVTIVVGEITGYGCSTSIHQETCVALERHTESSKNVRRSFFGGAQKLGDTTATSWAMENGYPLVI